MSWEAWRYVSLGVGAFFAAASVVIRLWIEFDRSGEDNMIRRFIRQMRTGNGGEPHRRSEGEP